MDFDMSTVAIDKVIADTFKTLKYYVMLISTSSPGRKEISKLQICDDQTLNDR